VTPAPMRLACLVYVVMGLYAFTLPHTPPQAAPKKLSVAELFGLDIMRGNRDRLIWVFIACVVLVSIPKKFYDSFLNNFMMEKGFVLHAFGLTLEPTGVQTLGQIIEALTLLALPFVMNRVGIKWVMVIGLASWVLRFMLFAYGFQGDSAIAWMVLLGIALHGLCYDFFFISGQIWFDQRFAPEMRSRAQSLYWFLLNGVGVVIGANIAGAVFGAWTLAPGRHDWHAIWVTPAVITFIVMVVFRFAFRQRPDAIPRTAGAPARS
jgi:MFS family permease